MRYDCLIIGAGHNGLICAATLARGGRSVLIVEAADQVGGAASTREFAPGFRVSAMAHLLHMLPDSLVRDLQLEAHGLGFAARGMPTTMLGCEALSAVDQAALRDYTARMGRYARAIAPLLSKVPPRLGTDSWADRLAMLRMGWQLRKLGRRDLRELLRIGGMNVYDLLEENFKSAALKGGLALDAVLGANAGPRSPGSVLTLLFRLAAESWSTQGLSQPIGGMGAVCDALAKSAQAAGAEVRLGAPVAGIVVRDDHARGVTLESGEAIDADCVVSSADPKTTFLRLLGTRHLDAGFVRRVNHIRARGLAAKLHLALDRLPAFTGVDPTQLRGRLLLSPSLDYIEHAYNHSKYGEFSAAPMMEITVPSMNDDKLAPPGQHVLSAILQYVPYTLKEGWQTGRQRLMDAALERLEMVAPGLRNSVLAAEVLAPPDIEREFRIDGGHWHHGDLAFDQFMMVRPLPGAAQHRTPMPGLFLCGAGAHPGGGVMGMAGRNAAQQVLDKASAP